VVSADEPAEAQPAAAPAPAPAETPDAEPAAPAAADAAPGGPAVEAPAEPIAGQPGELQPLDPFTPAPQTKLDCSEYCGQGVYVSCHCDGSGTCTSQSGWSGWVECLCNSGPDDEEVCPGYGGGGCPPASSCPSGKPCTSGSCICGTGTCVNGSCNCLI
jgi:hypothetical protein